MTKRRLFTIKEDTQNAVTIDGFAIGTSADFKVTKDYVVQRFNEFNEKYFGNQLEVAEDKICVRLTQNKFGAVFVKINEKKGTSQVEEFLINSYYIRPEKNICETILHEMIHVYQHEVLFPLGKFTHEMDIHGDTFINKMKELNSVGWNVVTESTSRNPSAKNYKPVGRKNYEEVSKHFIPWMNSPEYYNLYLYLPKDLTKIHSTNNGNILYNVVEKMWNRKGVSRDSNSWVVSSQLSPYIRFTFGENRDYYIYNILQSEFSDKLKNKNLFSSTFAVTHEILGQGYASDFTKKVKEIQIRTFKGSYKFLQQLEASGAIKSIDGRTLPNVEQEIKESTTKEKQLLTSLENDPDIKILDIEGDWISLEIY